jgi:hypothetical protein
MRHANESNNSAASQFSSIPSPEARRPRGRGGFGPGFLPDFAVRHRHRQLLPIKLGAAGLATQRDGVCARTMGQAVCCKRRWLHTGFRAVRFALLQLAA